MKSAVALLALHVLAVAGAAFGLVVLIPHPHLWSHLPGAGQAYAFAMEHSGPAHIVFGALAMIAYGAHAIGLRRTLIFFGIASALSLGMELLGTGTGWPFGAYSYTAGPGLGAKILGRVPWSIPLSWFHVGFVSLLLARAVIGRVRPRAPSWATVALGVWLLVAWDLVLDPAMAHEELPLRFWIWHQRGAYVGMPLANLAGWVLCGALYMGLSRWAWGGEVDDAALHPGFLFAMYAVNVLFGVALCASLGLWGPIALAFVAGIAPAALVFLPRRGAPALPGELAGSPPAAT